MSHNALKHCKNLHSICSYVARRHENWTSEIRTGRLLVWWHCDPPSARVELAPLIIDDCRNSMVTLTVRAVRQLAASFAGICKLSAEAVEASIEASSSRHRAILMCKAADNMPTVMLNRLLGIRAITLIHTWAAATAGYRARILDKVSKIRTSITDVVTDIRPLLAHWLLQAYCPTEDKLGKVLSKRALWLSIAAQSKMEAGVTVWRRQVMNASVEQVETAVDTTAMAVDTTQVSVDIKQPKVDSTTVAAGHNAKPASCNATAAEAPPSVGPVVTYLAEERQVLRTFFKERIGDPHIHLYLASTTVKNLPGGTFNPCEKKHRGSDFNLRIPIKRKVGQDVAIGQLSKLLPDRPELFHIQVCTRSPIAAQLARTVLKSITIREPTAEKCGGWDDIPASSILFRPPHPSKGNKRVKLEGKPPPEELAAEKEFEAACMGASLGGATEKKYKGWVQQFNEYCCRCETELLLETSSPIDAIAALKDLRFWVRRFLLNEGGVRGLQFSSINCKAYAIRWHFLLNFGLDVLADWVEHKIFMRGLKRVRHSPQRKMPVSWALLMYIVRQLLNDGSARSLVIMVAILVGWWFLCRISEIIAFRIGNVKFYDASGDKLDIDKDDLMTAVEVDLIFGVTKNDVDGDGAIRTHSKVLSILCVVSGLAKMVTYRRDQAAKKSMNLDPMSPLFKFVDDSKDSGSEKQLTRNTIVRVLKAAASAAGIPEAKISCHSLRSGGAVAMLSVSGSSYSDVRLFGRWRSDCARIYLRAVRGMMTQVSARMAANSTDCSVMLAGGSRVKRY